MTKDECLKALKTLQDKYLNLDVVDELICFKSLIEEHFDNPPLTFEYLENGALYFDTNNKPCRYYANIGKMKYANGELRDFEEYTFFRKQVEE